MCIKTSLLLFLFVGQKFWKTTCCKIYAVQSKVLGQLLDSGLKGWGKKRAITYSDSENGEDDPPKKPNLVLEAVNKLRKDVMNTRYSQLFMAVCKSI